ncbi:putative nuclease HARBI1 [Anthonomus grandis grandis]|uniref:putative nuclease HARBI1 n=1 Tax=Anthonomus grandis grandis TaxID=2921223 RepID=UPI002166617B|nr:putative nuclease HARBI1 [Anthonomus grandis grandis]
MSDDGLTDFLSDSDSSEDEFLELLPNERVKNEQYLENTVLQYSEETFFEHFRLSREKVNYLGELFGNSQFFHHQAGQFGYIPASDQILIYLWYAGHQTASFRDVGDRFNITISSVNRIIRRLTLFLSNMSPEIKSAEIKCQQNIKWPNDDEKRISEEHFRRNGFPNNIGAIDGSHVKIDKPVNDPDSYINRKGYYSIQVQAVCNHQRKIIDCFIGYPGSVHDSRVYRNSPLKNTLEQKYLRYFILGDSGHPLKPNLLTPYKDRGNLTRRQQNYNIKLARNRYVIEHTFGILKQKFRQLSCTI